MRLKVNESKTVYIILASQGIRTRENLDNRISEIDVCGVKVKNVKVGKALGLLKLSREDAWPMENYKRAEERPKKIESRVNNTE